MPVETFDPRSSMLNGASYDSEAKEMTVTLRGKSYTTPGVTPEDWLDFKSAPSPGRWYQINIMGRRLWWLGLESLYRIT